MPKKGMSTSVSELLFGIAALMVALVIITMMSGKISPADSAEVESLKLANEISIFLNSMSTVEQGHVRINISKPVNIHVKYIGSFDSQRWSDFWQEIKQVEIVSGASELFKNSGFYVLVTPYVAGKQRPVEQAFIISYPDHADKSLEKSFEKPKAICIEKTPDKDRAEVEEC